MKMTTDCRNAVVGVGASLRRLCVTAIAHPCAFTLALLVSHRAKLGASIIAHPCAFMNALMALRPCNCGRLGRCVLAATLGDRL